MHTHSSVRAGKAVAHVNQLGSVHSSGLPSCPTWPPILGSFPSGCRHPTHVSVCPCTFTVLPLLPSCRCCPSSCSQVVVQQLRVRGGQLGGGGAAALLVHTQQPPDGLALALVVLQLDLRASSRRGGRRVAGGVSLEVEAGPRLRCLWCMGLRVASCGKGQHGA